VFNAKSLSLSLLACLFVLKKKVVDFQKNEIVKKKQNFLLKNEEKK